jgi:hypothetical protein
MKASGVLDPIAASQLNLRNKCGVIREARAIYDGIFPLADPVSEQQEKAAISRTVSGANADRSDGVLLS